MSFVNTCKECWKQFSCVQPHQSYCSVECRNAAAYDRDRLRLRKKRIEIAEGKIDHEAVVLSNRLERAISHVGSVQELERRMGVSRTTLYKWINCENAPTARMRMIIEQWMEKEGISQ